MSANELRELEVEFVRTGVFSISEFFRINKEMETESVTFDLILPTYNEWFEIEYRKEKKVFDLAWVKSVLK